MSSSGNILREARIIIDNRERNLGILEGLVDKGVGIMFAQLPVGDYILSDRLCVERKTAGDFEKSIIDTRLFEQAKRLRESFEKPMFIIEGSENSHSFSRNVLIGAILKLYTEFNVQVLFSEGEGETAYILSRLAEREQLSEERKPRLIGYKKAYTTYQWQTLILGSIPGIGPKLAHSLLLHFKTLRNAVTADAKELMEVDKIGKKKAEKIYAILNAEFSEASG